MPCLSAVRRTRFPETEIFQRKSVSYASTLAIDRSNLHSFTPVYNGNRRDLDIGILHDTDSRLADAMLQAVPEGLSAYTIKRNEPYGPEDGVTHTLKRHAVASNLFNVMIEIRNDLLASDTQCRDAAAGIEQWLSSVLTVT